MLGIVGVRVFSAKVDKESVWQRPTVIPPWQDGRMPPKRPVKLKQSIARLQGVARERAIHAEGLIENHGYSREAADLLAFTVYPLDDDVATTREFAREIGSLSMDVAAFAETSTPGGAVHAAAMALHGFRSVAESHGNEYYLARFDRAVTDVVGTEARFGD